MPSQKILLYPHPILKKMARAVETVDDEIKGLLEDLIDTMREGPGSVGVAAPQIGVSLRVCVVDVSNSKLGKENNHGLLALINPEIVERDGEAFMREGCMSVPDYTGDVARSTRVVIRYLNEQGIACELEATGFEAVALQHEMDHLDGVLFLDRIASIKTGLFRRKSYR
ncbi:peptide deformylase [Geobacter pelophilus]|uniref:Peptide deformylase n=1 Tax=Geoanaerobacter pelophilus TaxID=60036 RepID=A0AAW4L030_9BACT|nr:peptide deformylase [Geoanaerobacter pelophilus]MBT0664198.1 peptide deformylase [Geoanaerobacter pelophilus]